MEKLFKLKQHGTTVRTEITAGLTTFFTMAYILIVNPSLLSTTGMNWGSVFTATCIAAAIGCILTAFMANAPFAQAPGMGLNAYFAFTVSASFGMGYTYQQGLAIVLISGALFLVIVVSPLRGKIIASIPPSLKAAIGAGIGLFITIIGMISSGVGIIMLDGENNLTGLNLFVDGAVNTNALLIIIGFLIMTILMAYKVKGAIFIGILITTVIGIPMGITQLPESYFNFDNITLSGTLFAFDFSGLMGNGILTLITAVVSFAVIDCFDTVGTLVGTAGNAGMLDKDGNLPGGDKALIADAIATVAGSALGTSTVTTYVESSAGIAEGGRTGLTSLTVGLMFIAALVFAPIAAIIPGAATAPALIIVGVLMMKSVTRVKWDDIEDAVPAFLTIVMMPFAYSISDGIGFGFISYVVIKLARGKAKEIPMLMYIISILFVLMYLLKGVI